MQENRQDTQSNSMISVRSVSKAFSSRPVLNDVNLEIAAGQAVCLCGVNGAGKSTLMRIIAGLLQPDSGTVLVNSNDITTEPEKSKPQLGVISHKSMVYSDLTVTENLTFFANLYGVQRPDERVKELMADVGLTPYRYDRASALSRGLLQRLSISRAMVHRPTVLLADEPFTGLDAHACRHLIEVLTGFADEGGTILMTTHDVSIGVRCCSRLVVLDQKDFIFDRNLSDVDAVAFSQDYLEYARSAN